jgi:magnesium transporter
LASLVEEMAPDDRADLLERMDSAHVERLMPLIAQAERADIRKLLSYPDHSAGSIMTTEYASLPVGVSVAEAIAQLRTQAPNSETIYSIYILDDSRRLRGFISLQKLILARPETPVGELMNKDVISVRVDEDVDLVAQKMARFDFIAVPVVDEQNRLVGIITHDDVLDVVQEIATQEAQMMGAVAPLENAYLSTPFLELAWKRGIWLVLLLVASFGTSSVLKHHEGITPGFEWMVWFLPLVMASGGNAGSQSATLIIRSLALGEMRPRDYARILVRELLTGLTLGMTLAVLGAAFASFSVARYETLVVGISVCLVVAFGTVNGTLLPLLLKRMGLDPALMSNPLIASLSDILAVVVYYRVADAVLTSASQFVVP